MLAAAAAVAAAVAVAVIPNSKQRDHGPYFPVWKAHKNKKELRQAPTTVK
jgi:hypothetical protein